MHLSIPAPTLDDDEVQSVELALLAEHVGEFSHRHPVSWREVMEPTKALKTVAEPGPLHSLSADRIGSIEDDESKSRLGRGLHAEHHRRLVRVIARANVLDIEDDCVKTAKLLGSRAERVRGVAVERVDRHSGPRIALVPHRGHVLRITADPVLRREQGCQLRAP